MAELHDTRSKALSDPDWYQGLVHVINLLQKEDRVCLDELSSIDKVQCARTLFTCTCIHLCSLIMYVHVIDVPRCVDVFNQLQKRQQEYIRDVLLSALL